MTFSHLFCVFRFDPKSGIHDIALLVLSKNMEKSSVLRLCTKSYPTTQLLGNCGMGDVDVEETQPEVVQEALIHGYPEGPAAVSGIPGVPSMSCRRPNNQSVFTAFAVMAWKIAL